MKQKKIFLIMYVIFILIFLFNFLSTSYAVNYGRELNIEKISNPNSREGQIDGLESGGNREASYSWAMAARGDYVYIGTNRNIIGLFVEPVFINALKGYGLTEDKAWELINENTNYEIPRPTQESGEILKCNIHTGEITKIIDKDLITDKPISFRMGIEYEGDLYFASFSSNAEDDNFIYKIDENDDVTIDFRTSKGTSMRAACIYEGSLVFGGVDASEILENGDESCTKLAIIKKDSSDGNWNRIADYKDFKQYTTDSAMTDSILSPIWDICEFKGEIYVVIPNSSGIVMFKGHPAIGNEKSNVYGWYWEEIIGKNSTLNNIGLAETKEGIMGNEKGLITIAATPFVFNNKLYLMNFDNTIYAEIVALSGILYTIAGQKVQLSDYLRPMYTTLNKPQKLWCYNENTGKFYEVENFTNLMKGTANEYLWRTAIYDNELYITTMDSSVLYNYATKLTGSNFTWLTFENIEELVNSIDKIILELSNKGALPKLIDFYEEIKDLLVQYKQILNDNEAFNNFVLNNEDLIVKIERVLNQSELKEIYDIVLKRLKELLKETAADNESVSKILEINWLTTLFDWEGLKQYSYILKTLNNNEWGFDIVKTADGINFEIVTKDGFGDRYNYGGRSLITTEKGLYVGTANPFYGTQLWRISKNIEESDDGEPVIPGNPDEDNGTEDNGTGDNGTGDNGADDNGTGDNGTGDNGTGDNSTGDNETGDNETGDNGTGDNGTGDNGTGDNGTGDNGTGDNGTGDNGTEEKEIEELKKELEELQKELEKLKDNNENINKDNTENDNTVVKDKLLPETGVGLPIILLTLAAVSIIIYIKYRKYANIDK